MPQKVKKIDRWEGLRARWTILPRGLLHPGRPSFCRLKGALQRGKFGTLLWTRFNLVGEAKTIRVFSGSRVSSLPLLERAGGGSPRSNLVGKGGCWPPWLELRKEATLGEKPEGISVAVKREKYAEQRKEG